MSGTLALSSVIASLDEAGLTALVRARRIASPGSVQDQLDLASELLKPDSITLALTALSAAELTTLAALTDDAGHDPHPATLERLRALGLTAATPLAEVTAALTALLSSRGLTAADLGAAELAHAQQLSTAPADSTPAGNASEGSGSTSAWFAAALTTDVELAWLLRELDRGPAKLNRNGGVASAWLKSVEERLAVKRPEELIPLVREAQLASATGTVFVANAVEWLELPHAERWVALATAAIALMPEALRADIDAPAEGVLVAPAIAGFSTHYPLATVATSAQIERAAALWERIGITVEGRLSAPGAAALTATLTPEIVTASGLPEPVPGVYIQPDLSIVVPGPLAIDDEATLCAIAVPEQLGVASTLRITDASLSAAFERGMTAAAIRTELEQLTLTGIPQPLDYLITALADRAGSIVVAESSGDDARSRITFAKPELRATLLVDRRLAHLQLHEAPLGEDTDADAAPLISRLRADHVLAALLDARYPAVAAGTAASAAAAANSAQLARISADTVPITTLSDDEIATALSAQGDVAPQSDPLADLIRRVLGAAAAGPTDISRQVTLAIRDRSKLAVTVEMRGQSRDFTIVPVSLAAGRLRALDESAGVERTFPLDAVVNIAAVLPRA